MTKTTFSLRLRLLLLLLLPPLYASAQEWTTRVGEVRKEQATTSRIGRNHAEEGLSDEELAASGRGYSVNGMFIGMVLWDWTEIRQESLHTHPSSPSRSREWARNPS